MISEELKKGVAKKRVAAILDKYPKTRESDKVLIIAYTMIWHRLHKRVGKEAMDIFKEVVFQEMPSFESIRRIRQKLNEEGKFLPPEKTLTARAEEESEIRAWSIE